MAKFMENIKTGLSNTLDKAKEKAAPVVDKAKEIGGKIKEADQKAGEWYSEHNLASKAGKVAGEKTAEIDKKLGDLYTDYNLAAKAGKKLGEATRNAPNNEAQQQAGDLGSQDNPSDGTPMGATWQERIKSGTASDDDIRVAAEAYKKGEYQPGPKTLEEFKKQGLIDDAPDNTGAVSDNGAANTESSPEMTEPQAATTAETPEQTLEQATEEIQNETPEQQQQTEQVARTVNEMSEEELNAISQEALKDMHPDEKTKMANIFQAYKNEQIDKGTRNYFLADALVKAATNVANVMDANVQNSMWSNIQAGRHVSPEMQQSEWNEMNKREWMNAQDLKHKLRENEMTERQKTALEIAKRDNMTEAEYKRVANVMGKKDFKDMTPDEVVQGLNLVKAMNGEAPLTADQASMLMDASGNAKDQTTLTKLAIQSAEKGNEAQALANASQAFANENMKKWDDLNYKLAQGQITDAELDREMKRLLNENQKYMNEVFKDTKDTQVKQARADYVNTAYGNIKGKLAFKVPGLGEAGAEVSMASLINMGYSAADAWKMIKQGGK